VQSVPPSEKLTPLRLKELDRIEDFFVARLTAAREKKENVEAELLEDIMTKRKNLIQRCAE